MERIVQEGVYENLLCFIIKSTYRIMNPTLKMAAKRMEDQTTAEIIKILLTYKYRQRGDESLLCLMCVLSKSLAFM